MSKFCPSCGEELVDNAKFCKNCGANIETNEKTNTQETATTYEVQKVAENDHKLVIIAGYIFALLIPLIGVIIGIYLYTRKDSEKANYHSKIILAIAIVIWIVSIILVAQ